MLTPALGSPALSLPMRGGEPILFDLGPYTLQLHVPSVPLLLHALSIQHPCRRAKSPRGTQLRLVSPLGWAKLGLRCLLLPPYRGHY